MSCRITHLLTGCQCSRQCIHCSTGCLQPGLICSANIEACTAEVCPNVLRPKRTKTQLAQFMLNVCVILASLSLQQSRKKIRIVFFNWMSEWQTTLTFHCHSACLAMKQLSFVVAAIITSMFLSTIHPTCPLVCDILFLYKKVPPAICDLLKLLHTVLVWHRFAPKNGSSAIWLEIAWPSSPLPIVTCQESLVCAVHKRKTDHQSLPR